LKTRLAILRKTWITLDSIGVELNLVDRNNHSRKVRIVWRDTFLLAPQKKKALDDLGELLNILKLPLPNGHTKDRMDLLLESDKAAFEAYAIRDAEIAARYAQKIFGFAQTEFGMNPPPTLGSIAVRAILGFWEKENVDPASVLGMKSILGKRYDQKTGRYVREMKMLPISEKVRAAYDLANNGFHGGRNEAFLFGPWSEGPWFDWDLKSAYPSAMAAFKTPDWDAIKETKNPDDYGPDTLGFAHIEFIFPEGTKFPCLPVRAEGGRGLVFPLKGECNTFAPEIALARKMGAEITIFTGFVVPWKGEDRPFGEFVNYVIARRKEHARDSLDNLLWKEIGNSVYGKTGQGLKGKKAFRTDTGETEEIGESQISSPFFAGFVTSLIRAAISEILWKIPVNRMIGNAITDGVLTTAPLDEMDPATTGNICAVIRKARERVLRETGSLLECKSSTEGVVVTRTRFHFGLGEVFLNGDGKKKPLCATVSVPREGRNEADFLEYVRKLFAERTIDTKIQVKKLPGARQLYDDDALDLVMHGREARLNADYDFKRQVDFVKSGRVAGIEHISFTTKPWESIWSSP
jgi:hypothetical protein